MTAKKYKRSILITTLLVLFVGSAVLFPPLLQTASANHDQCYGLSTLDQDIGLCTQQKRDATNRACYASNEGNDTAIAECVRQSTAHYSVPPDVAPSLPSGVPSTNAGESRLDGDCKNNDLNKTNCGIVAYIVTFTRVLSAIVGIVIVIMVTIGGIQFSSARDNPQAVAAARNRIFNALLALVVYMFAFAILQWLVPGGVI